MQDKKWEKEKLLEEKYGGKKCEAFFADLARLGAGEPLSYIIGHIPFLGTTIYLDSHPLIPRPETEYWTEKALADIKDSGKEQLRVLDLCAGSGCIGVAVLKKVPQAHVDFVELEEQHHQTIRKNIKENGIDNTRARIFGGSLFEEIRGMYNFILTNPPYIDPALDRAAGSVRNFEPHEALYGGKDGLVLIRAIIAGASAHLVPDGTLYIEHEPEQATDVRKLAKECGFDPLVQKDQYGVLRYAQLGRNQADLM
jgi:release factor glutamine methyltransferase